MKYLVVSDSHGDRDILVDLLQRYKSQVDLMLHCGDSELEPTDSLWNDFRVVGGNCDYDPSFLNERLEVTDVDRIYMTHGHLVNVRFGLTTLEMKAAEVNASIVLFGHTHEIGCEMHQHRLFLNPGSIRLPRGPIQVQSYCIIDSTKEQLEVQYYNREHQKQKQLHFFFKK